MRILAGIATFAFLFLTAGCDQSKPATAPVAPAHNYTMFQGPSGAFLVDIPTGKVYQLDTDRKAFLEVPVTSEISEYVYDASGKLVKEGPTPSEGDRKTNTSSDHVVFHDGKWQLDTTGRTPGPWEKYQNKPTPQSH